MAFENIYNLRIYKMNIPKTPNISNTQMGLIFNLEIKNRATQRMTASYKDKIFSAPMVMAEAAIKATAMGFKPASVLLI